MSTQQDKLEYIANKIIQLREEVDWNQATLAKNAGISPAAISLIEKRKRLPSMMVARKLASALMVSIGDLTGEQPERAKAISNEATVFFRDWQDLEKLEDSDKQMIKGIINRLKEQKSDEG